MSAYDAVIGGSLKLKRKSLPSNSKKKKKKVKREETSEVKQELGQVDAQEKKEEETEEKSPDEEEKLVQNLDGVDEDLLLLEEEQDPKWTPAEKAFQLARKKREKERVNERLKFTHRQRMEKLNAHLASLSEHFDQPRVGPG
ncbi:ribophorin related protein [Cystoisospora suis]|uniref:Ribophorin related protein n=1 Tax=Cystoisospora suis TaxID=483139 RepID=A0A2C6LHX8_9APIC|nr:ribophorin related protein [Cystoisospora suis]